jgi:tetratricopeptide (TPR) repeat protein
MYESIAQFSDAARYYEAYAESFPRGEHAADSLYNAVLLRVTAGDHGNAVEDGNEFLRRFPRHDKKDDVYFFIGRAQENAENWSEAAATYRRFIRGTRNLDLKVEATTRLGMVLQEDGNRRGAASAFEDAVRLGRRNASRLQSGLYYAAQARYLQGEAVLREYESVQIAGPTEGLTQRLQRKAELLRRAATIFTDVVSFQVAEWVTAALFQIGRSFETFAADLNNQPIPEGFNEEEEASYRDQLYQFIIPMEQQAIDAYQGGYQKAIELQIYNRWTAKLREGLTRLDDQTYPPLREMGGQIVEGAPLAPPQPLDGLRRGSEGESNDDGDDEEDEEDEDDEEADA